MARKTATERKKDILETARDMIFNDSFSNFTIRALAENIGISEPAIYRHFLNKETLLLKLLASLFDPWRNAISKLAASSDSVKSKLTKLVKLHIEFLFDKKLNPILFFSEASAPGSEATLQFLQLNLSFLHNQVNQLVSKGVENNEFNSRIDKKAATACIIGLMQSTIIKWTIMRDENGLKEEAQTNIDFMLSCLTQGVTNEK